MFFDDHRDILVPTYSPYLLNPNSKVHGERSSSVSAPWAYLDVQHVNHARKPPIPGQPGLPEPVGS